MLNFIRNVLLRIRAIYSPSMRAYLKWEKACEELSKCFYEGFEEGLQKGTNKEKKMKKMKTLFRREFLKNGNGIEIFNEVTKGCEWVQSGEGKAYVKLDGTSCMIKDECIYKRFDYKKGRALPKNAIPCQESADQVTGHFPHWVKCNDNNLSDKYHLYAFAEMKEKQNGTYELIGEKINGNKHFLKKQVLIKHDHKSIEIENPPRTYEEILKYLIENKIEGIVYHRENGEMCKIKRNDFAKHGLKW